MIDSDGPQRCRPASDELKWDIPDDVMKGRIFVLAAALLILPEASGASDAAPPSGSPWKMTFSGEFQRQDLSLKKWTVKCRSSSDRSQADVLRDNVQINNGVCRLLARKSDDGKRWTNAQVFSKAFTQKYGYFEARIKTSETTGLTNVFALVSHDSKTSRLRFYVDVVHAVYPHTHCTRVGILGGAKGYPDKSHRTEVDLSTDYHLYGLQWTDRELIWYFDGREIRRLSHTLLQHAARVQLVTWGGGFDGEVTDAMEVDYVRVYKKLPRPPNWSDWHDGIE